MTRLTREAYLSHHPKLRKFSPFMRPSAARRMGIANPYIVLPPYFDERSMTAHELARTGQIHRNGMKLHELGLSQSGYDPRFLYGKRWRHTEQASKRQAERSLSRAASAIRPSLSRRVSAKRTLRRSPSFRQWREHVRYRPGGSGYASAKRSFERASAEQDLNQIMALLGD